MSPTVRCIVGLETEPDVERSYRRRISTGLSQLDWIIRERVKIHSQTVIRRRQYALEHRRFAQILAEAKAVRASAQRHLERGELYLALECLLQYNINC
jgi:hypothetical protein